MLNVLIVEVSSFAFFGQTKTLFIQKIEGLLRLCLCLLMKFKGFFDFVFVSFRCHIGGFVFVRLFVLDHGIMFVNVNIRPNLDVWVKERLSSFNNEDSSNINYCILPETLPLDRLLLQEDPI